MRVILISLVLGGCGLFGDVAMTRHCDLRDAAEGGGECQEYGVFGPDIVVLQGTCEAVGGDWGDSECPRDGITGGCENVEASNPWSVTSWYYAADGYETPDDVRNECDDETEVYVDPPS